MKQLSQSEFIERFKEIELLALDVDGVLTDDGIFFGPDGLELKKFNISDGFFMVLAMRTGLELAIVSGRHSPATDSRMKDLGVKHVLQGMKSKIDMLAPTLDKLDIPFSKVAFVGNEILDIPLAEKVGLSIAVADSSPLLIERVDYVTKCAGGKGAVREVLHSYFDSRSLDPREFIK
ncbi:MAG: HAD hydrolase family protein [bacterium]|nr:HAD hydrolase family protein [bacterium]